MSGIKIDRLEIRLRGVSPGVARASSQGLGHAVLEQLIRERLFLHEKPHGKIHGIVADTLGIKMDAGPSDLRSVIAGGVVDAIASQNSRKTEKEG